MGKKKDMLLQDLIVELDGKYPERDLMKLNYGELMALWRQEVEKDPPVPSIEELNRTSMRKKMGLD